MMADDNVSGSELSVSRATEQVLMTENSLNAIYQTESINNSDDEK